MRCVRRARLERSWGSRPVECLVLAACDPANPFGAALPWPPARDEHAGHRPGRKAGALVVIADGALVAYVERGGRDPHLDGRGRRLAGGGRTIGGARQPKSSSLSIKTVNGIGALTSEEPINEGADGRGVRRRATASASDAEHHHGGLPATAPWPRAASAALATAARLGCRTGVRAQPRRARRSGRRGAMSATSAARAPRRRRQQLGRGFLLAALDLNWVCPSRTRHAWGALAQGAPLRWRWERSTSPSSSRSKIMRISR